MKNIGIHLLASLCLLTACSTVDSGHRGVQVSWGGETNMETVYDEGLQMGINWIWDDMVNYDCREQTLVIDNDFNDANNMETGVEVALYYHPIKNEVNLLHKNIGIDYKSSKMKNIMKGALKEVIPQFSAVDLNLKSRSEAEERLTSILTEELASMHVEFVRVQITDVDIPKSIAQAAEAKAVQLEKNKLAKEKAEEQTNLGNAAKEKALADAEATRIRAEAESKAIKTINEALSSSPQYVQLKKVEKWDGSLGDNNVFGSDATIIKGLVTK